MPKKVEREIEIAATPDEVWRALSDGEELKRWFPLDARVKPGAGGSVWLSWGEGAEWESPIEIWEPGKRLQPVDTIPGQEGAPPTRIAVDYVIERAAEQRSCDSFIPASPTTPGKTRSKPWAPAGRRSLPT